MQVCGRRYDNGQLIMIDISQEKISRVSSAMPADADPSNWPWIAPGLIDLQINGYRGQEFSSARLTAEKVAAITAALDALGVVRYCPTLTTASLDVLTHGLKTIALACRSVPALQRRIVGIHLEGPYLSKEDGVRGAHPKQHCRQPDWEEFCRLQEAGEGRIRILTMAVEFEQAPAFIRRVVESGVVVGIGHTAADAHQIKAAVDAGARLSTHLGNGSHPMIPRHHNYLWPQLAEDRLRAGLIVDGHHLPPEVVKTFVRAKTPSRCILVSDMAGQAGLPPGRYHGDLGEVEILPSGRLVVAGQTEVMAGASLPIGVGVANVMHFAQLGLEEAIRMAVHQPAELLGIEPGGLQPGDPADLVLFHLDAPPELDGPPVFRLQATVVGGQLRFGAVDPHLQRSQLVN